MAIRRKILFEGSNMRKNLFLIFLSFFLLTFFGFGSTFNSMTNLVKNSVAIFMCKYPGHGDSVKVIGTLKGTVPRDVKLGEVYLENMEPGTLYIVFAKKRNPWRVFPDGYIYLTYDEVAGRVWRSPMNLEKLFKNIDPQVRSELYRIPAPIHRKTHHPITIGTLVDEISHLPEGSPVSNRIFGPALKGVIKSSLGERYGRATPPANSLPRVFNVNGTGNFKPGIFQGKVSHGNFKRNVKDITSCSGGTVLNIGDEGNQQINFTSFSFPYMGTTYTSCYVTDNGYITFGSAYNTYYVDLYHFFSYMPPVIAPFFNDFDPGSGGTISYVETANELIICWDEMPDYWYPSYTCSFALHLYSDGSFMFEYGTMDVYWQGIMGFSDGSNNTHTLSGDYDFSYLMGNTGVAQINGNYKNVFDDYSNDLGWIDYGMVYFSGNPTGIDPADNLDGYDSMSNAYVLDVAASPTPGWFSYTSPDGGHLSPGETVWYKIEVPGQPDEQYIIDAKVTSYDAYDDYADTMIGVFDENGNFIDYFDDVPGWFGSYDPHEKVLVPGGTTLYICVTGTGDYGFSGNHTEDGSIGVHITVMDWTGYPLPLGDDDYITLLLPQNAPFPIAGYEWPAMYLCSNGFVSFDYPDTNYDPNEGDLESGPVRACMYWDDLSPNYASYPYGVYYWTNTEDPEFMYAGIQFYGVPTYDGDMTNFASFFIADGTMIDMFNLTSDDGLVGYGIGNGFPTPGSKDLSAKINSTSVIDWGTGLKSIGTGLELYYYELFDSSTNPCDLGIDGGFNSFQFFGMYNYTFMGKDVDNSTYAYFNDTDASTRCKFLSLQKDYIFLSPTMYPVAASFRGNYYFGVNDRMYPGYIQTKGKFDMDGNCTVYLINYYYPGHLFKCIGNW